MDFQKGSEQPKKKFSYQSAVRADSPASYINIRSKQPIQDDYTPMRSFTPSSTLDPMIMEKAFLPQSKDACVDMSGGDVPSAPSGQKGNTNVEVLQKEREEVEERKKKKKRKEKKLPSQSPVTFVNISAEDLNLAKEADDTGDTGKNDIPA